MDRLKRSKYNIIFGLVSQAVTIALGIFIPRLVLVNLGSESNGLLSSVTQILSYLALLEAGVGAATSQALYQPVGANDHASISAILAATDRFYKRTGRVYLAILIALSFFYPLFVHSELSYWTIWSVIILSGLPNVITYYFQAKYRLLLAAEGKTYISVNLTTFTTIGTSLSKIILLMLGFDVVALQAMYLGFSLIQVAFFAWYIHKHYAWLDLSVRPDFSAISQKSNALIHQISGLIFSNTDVAILTFFCGLKEVSVYTMYSMLYGMIRTLNSTLNSSITFILGQEFHNNRQKYLQLHDAFELGNMLLTFSTFATANIFILPFLSLYTSGVVDIQYIDRYLPYLFVTTTLLSNARTSSSQAIIYAGHFKQTQYRALLEAAINLTVSLICVYHFGIYGVLFGTIAALLYRTNDMIIYANTKILHRNPWITYRRWLINLATYAAVIFLSTRLHPVLSTYPLLILWAGIYAIVIVGVFCLVNYLAEPQIFKGIVGYIRSAVRR